MNPPMSNIVGEDFSRETDKQSSDFPTEEGDEIDGTPAASSQRTQRKDAPSEFYKSEENRRNSFRGFPKDSPMNANDLAKAGFYYLGCKDIVRCFSCSNRVKEWEVGDSPNDEKWHKDACDFINGRECGNIPA